MDTRSKKQITQEDGMREKKRKKMQRYRKNVKADEIRREAAKEKDRERKREERARKKAQQKNDKGALEAAREQKRLQMQRYREKLKQKKMGKVTGKKRKSYGTKAASDASRLQKKLEVQQKKKAVMRTQNWRLKIVLQEKDNTADDSPVSPFSSRWSEYRAVRKARNQLPSTPRKKAVVLEKLMDSPKTRDILEKKGAMLSPAARKKLKVADVLMESVGLALEDTKAKPGSCKAQKACHKALYQAAIGKVAKKYHLTNQLSKLLKTRRYGVKERWWQSSARKPRRDKLPQPTVDLVHDWYTSGEIAREVPCKKKVTKEKDTAGQVHIGPQYCMTVTLKEAYELFKHQHPNLPIGYTSFCKLKPKQVKRVSETSRRTCLCQTCCNIALKLEGLKNFSANKEDLKEKMKTITSKREFADLTLCKYDDKPDPLCLKRQCTKCCPAMLTSHFDDVQVHKDDTLEWAHWEYVLMNDVGEKSKRVLACINKKTTMAEFLLQCEKELESFPAHIFEAVWQQSQINQCIGNYVTDQNVMVVMDFAENFRVFYKDEVQSAFFEPTQISIHPMMYYYKDADKKLVKHALIAISDDLRHDASAVKHFEQAAVDHLSEQGMQIKSLHIWSDGCAAQYKGKNAFFDLTEQKIPVTHNFFVTSHGKSVCDGLGAVVKNMAYRHVMGGHTIASPKDLFAFCKEKATYAKKEIKTSSQSYISKREFLFVPASSVARERPEVKTLAGTRKLHVVRNTDKPLILEKRNLSCYCTVCTATGDEDDRSCENRNYVDAWVQQELRLVASLQTEEQCIPYDAVPGINSFILTDLLT